ncbi:nucleoporin autopeptidase-domain-containing protein [Mycena metata]|uniref:Nucleoporin autopeptidase-domain-containing protein n=1 Tax=Mycena metata TaxID=1033252 RepID=A0AAD7IEE1_9AGAR|nr:nucleoporin autopeptidase-domain-containing protein [Mycena metata]
MFSSTWGNNNQQAQQQQPSTFGQPSAFGAPAFGGGTTGAFGQPQQQQPQANPMFGNLAASTSNNTGGGFGAFGGGTTPQSNAVNPMFGGAKPATGFGAFGGGGNNAFGGGGAFGQNNAAAPATTAFGQPANTSAFGQQTNPMFGKPATTAFGAPAAANANGEYPNVPPVTTGSSNPVYAPFSEKDPMAASTTLSYQSISCIPAYRGTSFEEIRLQDYAQGRKTAGAFGQSAAFGGVQQQPTTNIFGQAQPAQQTSVFGGGAAQPTTGFGAFGNTAPAATSAPAFGAFGQQTQPQQPATSFGAFGQQQQPQQQQQTSIFGGGTTGAFGNNAAKPAFGAFGATPAFGTNNATNPLGGNTQQPATTNLFGGTATAQPTTGFGGFGATSAPKTNIFGQPAAQPATQNAFGSTTNLFGTNSQQQPAQPAATGFGGFGTNNAQAQQQQPANPNPLFGGGTNTNPLFGGGTNAFNNNNQQQQQQQQQQQPSLFGTKPLFSGLGATPTNAPAATPSLFGNSLGQQNQQQQQPSPFGGGFGAKPLAPPLGQSNSMGQSTMFGGFNNSTNMFSATASNAGAQGTLTASIAQPIATDLFSMLPPGPHAVNLEQSTKKKVPFFVDVPTRSPIPRVGLSYTPAGSKLRGFGASMSAPQSSPGNPFAFSTFSNSSKPGVLSLGRVLDSPDSIQRSLSPSLGSGSRHSVKKLILDKKVEPGELFSKSGGSGSPGSAHKKITFSPALSIAAREKESATALTRTAALDSPTPAPRPPPANRFTAQNTQNEASGSAGANANPEEGEYWVRPDLATLRQAGYEKLSSFKDLVVGRVGYGEIHFLEPVDLTGLPKLGALLGEVVRFDDKECSVYPDSDEVDKPPPGSGLNVRAQLSLLRCWAVDKATREPIKDATHPNAVKHLKRLKNMKDTHFEGFDLAKGEWTFTVDHF